MIVAQPHVNTEKILKNLEAVFESKWLGMGPMTKKFEEALAKYWGIDPESVICTNSCTEALRLAVWLHSDEHKSKREYDLIATTPMTFVSTNHAIMYHPGNSPVFYDVEPRTGLVNTSSLETVCKDYDISAIVVVHIAGQPADMNKVNQIADTHGCTVIEDCAHAMGSSYPNGRMVGNNDNISCFSFHAVKNLAIGDGGAIVLGGKWKKHAAKVRSMRWMGIDKDTFSRSGKSYSWDYDVTRTGFKSHMNDVCAAIGLAQLEDLDVTNNIRRYLSSIYIKKLPDHCHSCYYDDSGSNYHLFLSFFEDRNAVADVLRDNGISPGMHYRSNLRYPMYKYSITADSLKGVDWYEAHELSLPMHSNLTPEDVERVCDVINTYLGGK